jgi:NAD(P)-dependent dehydrogenase (short-subunit alcohol dehydrogenase family)
VSYLDFPLITTFFIDHPTVTGGAGALALASARALLEHGLNGLALLDLQAGLDKGAVHIEALRQAFPSAQIVTFACDVTSESEVQGAVQNAREALGPLKVLCCFAGFPLCVGAEDMTFEQWRKVTDVNLTGSWLAAQAVGR